MSGVQNQQDDLHQSHQTCTMWVPSDETATGCGNSSLSFDLYQKGFSSITNIDYSGVCIETMARRHADCPGMRWLKMDARHLAFSEGTFEVVLEKGTLDAMMVEEKDPWSVSAETAGLLQQVLKESVVAQVAGLLTASPDLQIHTALCAGDLLMGELGPRTTPSPTAR
ncbi:hypothetical protein Z043_102562 [Scleropages formosus]|uniref:Methyltransferase domain-containing protein n=1 Tax=Scleropages formosus TaxID=113540 RepID=A0A0P7VV21_SCLFO|nr:hypothetical protein Z043_102562 [Scleropages formosus]